MQALPSNFDPPTWWKHSILGVAGGWQRNPKRPSEVCFHFFLYPFMSGQRPCGTFKTFIFLWFYKLFCVFSMEGRRAIWFGTLSGGPHWRREAGDAAEVDCSGTVRFRFLLWAVGIPDFPINSCKFEMPVLYGLGIGNQHMSRFRQRI